MLRQYISYQGRHKGTLLGTFNMKLMWQQIINYTSLRAVSTSTIVLSSSSSSKTAIKSFGNKADILEASIPLMRNIGVVAHIDAGKTTTTERMLFYAGVLRRIGDVDNGTTTTDFMKEEVDRGITIQSAAVSLQWQDCSIHLIDTPGHVDFTVEVERAMRVVDGVVALFDASAGVQAQSYTVLRQSRKFGIPVIGFLNKMDKYNANFEKCIASIRAKLEVEPLLLQVPLLSVDGGFDGVLDVVEMTSCRFTGPHGTNVERRDLRELEIEEGAEKLKDEKELELLRYELRAAQQARHALLATLTAVDDPLAEALIAALDTAAGVEAKAEGLIPVEVLRAAIRRQTLRQDIPRPMMPVLCGASRRNQGVQPLLDAIKYYLPSPQDRLLTGYTRNREIVPLPPATASPHIPFIALAFKVTHAMSPKGRRQPLVFFRVYSGKIIPNMTIINNSNNRHEKIEKLYVMHANHQVEVPQLIAGEIGAAFMQHTTTGATLYRAPQHIQIHSKDSKNEVFTLEGIDAPPPVISFSIEAATKQQISLLESALQELSFEDPSLCVHKNDFGQMVISGMGELHLEIIMSRLENEYQLKCRLLRAIIEYREVIKDTVELNNKVGLYNEIPYIQCSLQLRSLLETDDTCTSNQSCCFIVDENFAEEFINGSNNTNSDHRRRRIEDNQRNAKEELRLIKEVFNNAVIDCSRLGPLAGFPLHGVQVVMTEFKKFGSSNLIDRSLSEVARSLLLELFRSAPKSSLAALEPMMEIEVHLSESTYIGSVINSLNERKAITVDIQEDGKSVKAILPMRNIVRYTMELRKAVKGHANLFTRLHNYRIIEDKEVLSRIMKNLGIYDNK